jgi:hypothetical protein
MRRVDRGPHLISHNRGFCGGFYRLPAARGLRTINRSTAAPAGTLAMDRPASSQRSGPD